MNSRTHLATTSLLGAAVCAALCLTVHAADPLQAAELQVDEGVLLVDSEHGVYGEALDLPGSLMGSLADKAFGERLRVLTFPTAPGERRTVDLRRIDPWAPGARLLRVADGETVELPKNRRSYFMGQDPSDLNWRVSLSFDPATDAVKGLVRGPQGAYELQTQGDAYRLVSLRHLGRQHDVSKTCEVEHEAPFTAGGPVSPFGDTLLDVPARVAKTAARGGELPSFQAIIALDTDNEFHHKKFNNNTAAATDWIEALFMDMNLFYERDLDLRLLIGETFFRLDTDPSPTYDDDPWNQPNPSDGNYVSNAQLNEFGNYWSANNGSVERVFASMLSGKSDSSNSAAGRAWLDGYCENQNSGGGYNFNMIFTGNFGTSFDSRLVGHEIGHNAGANHTHCYTPPIDTCWGQEPGCWSGATSCPAEGSGTVMSYCNFGACGSAQTRSEFHPTMIGILEGFRDNHYPGCITDLLPANLIFGDGFESGNTSEWSS